MDNQSSEFLANNEDLNNNIEHKIKCCCTFTRTDDECDINSLGKEYRLCSTTYKTPSAVQLELGCG